jgi:hypothetical protein
VSEQSEFGLDGSGGGEGQTGEQVLGGEAIFRREKVTEMSAENVFGGIVKQSAQCAIYAQPISLQVEFGERNSLEVEHGVVERARRNMRVVFLMSVGQVLT